MMKQYIGTKMIHARPMTRGAYNEYRGWTIPANENPEDEGYLVRYSDSYESWSPKDVFEKAYRETTGIPFCPTIPEPQPNKIYDICILVAHITDAEVQEIRDIAQGQLDYISPLRMATTAKQNDLGRHNMDVLDALLKLKEVIESGAHLDS